MSSPGDGYDDGELIHWTGRTGTDADAVDVVRSICNERVLRMIYCPTYVRDELQRRGSMVCFTDIPFSQSAEHCRRFGRSGIAFKKRALIGYGANPVLYTTSEHFPRIVALSALLDRMADLEKDRSWKKELEPYGFREEETWALLEVLGFLQDYSYKGRLDPEAQNYSQREWRMTFQALPFASGSELQKPGMGCVYIEPARCTRQSPLTLLTSSS